MSEPFLGEIKMFAGNFAPRGWATCNGQLLAINQNQALFSLLGTTYGGNGQTTFALPDMRSRVPIHNGQGPGLSPYVQGQQGGSEAVTLLANQLPAHGHPLYASSDAATPAAGPAGNVVAGTGTTSLYAPAPSTTMAPGAIAVSGGSQPHNNVAPSLCVTFIIALQGIFPSRN